MQLRQFRVFGVVVFEHVEVDAAAAVGGEEDLLAVGRPRGLLSANACSVSRVHFPPPGFFVRNSCPWMARTTLYSSGERAYSVASRVNVLVRSVFDLSSAFTSMASLRGEMSPRARRPTGPRPVRTRSTRRCARCAPGARCRRRAS